MEWIKCSDTMPPIDKMACDVNFTEVVLVYDVRGHMLEAYFDFDCWSWCSRIDLENKDDISPTHWMVLPRKPKS